MTSLFGRRINIPDSRAKAAGMRQFAERAAINAPIQGAAADIIRRAMVRMPAALAQEGLKARMLLQVHDELVFEAPASEAGAVCALAKRVMERAAEPAVQISAPLIVEAKAAKNWDEAHYARLPHPSLAIHPAPPVNVRIWGACLNAGGA